MLTLVALVGLAFRLPQASAFLLGQASVTLWLGLCRGLLPSALAGERSGFSLLALSTPTSERRNCWRVIIAIE